MQACARQHALALALHDRIKVPHHHSARSCAAGIGTARRTKHSYPPPLTPHDECCRLTVSDLEHAVKSPVGGRFREGDGETRAPQPPPPLL